MPVNSGAVCRFHHDLEENKISSKGLIIENLNIVWFQMLVEIILIAFNSN